MQTSADGSSSGQLSKKVLRAPFSTRLDEETIYILNRVKLEEGIKIYEAIESAVKQQWGTYGRKK
uniref:hypothetical protein n=1 Tax=Arthrobacter sp. TaxID=1667 RepID=UPI00159ECC2A|nr:hypothetical protein [Arthrobacter sp.]